jgi:hypothetical protein
LDAGHPHECPASYFRELLRGAQSRSPVRLRLVIRLLAPAFLIVVAEEVLPPAAIAIALAIVALLPSELATAPARLGLDVLARERIGVTFQTLSTYVGVIAAVVAPKTPCLSVYALAEGRATNRAYSEQSQRAPSRRLHHPAATGLLSNYAGEIVKPISVHAFLPN